jgi:hypothetical protein
MFMPVNCSYFLVFMNSLGFILSGWPVCDIFGRPGRLEGLEISIKALDKAGLEKYIIH